MYSQSLANKRLPHYHNHLPQNANHPWDPKYANDRKSCTSTLTIKCRMYLCKQLQTLHATHQAVPYTVANSTCNSVAFGTKTPIS